MQIPNSELEINPCFFCLLIKFQLDPAGWLPKCFVNRFNTKLVMIIDNLKKQVLSASPTNSDDST